MAAVILAALMVTMAAGSCQGVVHKVGGESGWTNINITSDFYSKWIASKDFNVGDVLLFHYNNKFHNLVRVNHRNFNSCNTTDPYFTRSSGNDSFVIPRTGHFYFLCGVPGHCQAGQKLDVRVLDAPSPSSGRAPAPAPSKTSGSSSSCYGGWISWRLLPAAAAAAFALY